METKKTTEPAIAAPSPSNEAKRLQKLLSYRVLDTSPEPIYDEITATAARICNTPIALISLIDVGRQWFKSKVGINATQTPRNHAFCAYTILQEEVMIVSDTWRDERFANNPLTTGAPHIRFYAGAPLMSAEGFALGSLCVIDTQPRQLTLSQVRTLKQLANDTVNQLERQLLTQQVQREASQQHTDDQELQQMVSHWKHLTHSGIRSHISAKTLCLP